MKILVVAAHPHLQQSKVNKAWIERLRQESSITLNDLHKEYPDKRIDVQKEQQLLLQHDRIVFQYPFYWYSAPAFLKQWMEEVLESQWMMGEGGRGLAGKELVLAISAGSHEQAYQAGGFQGFSMSEFTKPMQALAGLIGMKFLPSFVFYGAAAASDDAVLHSAEQYVKHILDPKLDPRIRLMEAINREA
ncbi:flavodoxin family protein [Paenibacillus sp. H1-7]|uniref:NAD(P)H-dependent oxidoreductase n=1 Tax=Paenibacillus sp. H1-7 TaxID=2282849 RepID=UPI001EF76CB5|nr:NAD(P)H-dependent oxidoreductase [Paenibacillus sp. H1-7]ULL16329.1 flavodoxin family protein [Paenibacillus sp. H1-7]